MRVSVQLDDDERTLSVGVPVTFAKRGGRKVIVAPDAESTSRSTGKPNEVLVRALARAFRWRKLIETGTYVTIVELASAEKVNPSYVSRMLQLTLVAPEVVEAILDGERMPGLTLSQVIRLFPSDWRRQRVTG